MKQRIIKISDSETTNEVLVQTFRDENGEDFVQISAWHTHNDDTYYQSMDITFNGDGAHEMMQCFIQDFTERSASEFAYRMKF